MFSIAHSLSCPKGGFPSIRHNEIRDLTANLLTRRTLQWCLHWTWATASNWGNPYWCFIKCTGWYTPGHCSQWRLIWLVDVNPHTPSHRQSILSTCYIPNDKNNWKSMHIAKQWILACLFHPTSFVCHSWYGQWGQYILQKACLMPGCEIGLPLQLHLKLVFTIYIYIYIYIRCHLTFSEPVLPCIISCIYNIVKPFMWILWNCESITCSCGLELKKCYRWLHHLEFYSLRRFKKRVLVSLGWSATFTNIHGLWRRISYQFSRLFSLR